MKETLSAACHCGAVKLEIELNGGLGQLIRCNCSLCRMKGAVMAGVKLDRLKVIEGEEFLTLYQWNTRVAKHYFCNRCGIYTHHQRRSVPDEYGVNVACFQPPIEVDVNDVVLVDGAAKSVVD